MKVSILLKKEVNLTSLNIKFFFKYYLKLKLTDLHLYILLKKQEKFLNLKMNILLKIEVKLMT